jgi:hypothetical protein
MKRICLFREMTIHRLDRMAEGVTLAESDNHLVEAGIASPFFSFLATAGKLRRPCQSECPEHVDRRLDCSDISGLSAQGRISILLLCA